jgi:hypothetical protein
MQSHEGQARAEERELATKEAVTFVRARFVDEEAWVRLLVTEGRGRAMIYHFDAFGPTIDEQARVTVSRSGADHWDTVLTE